MKLKVASKAKCVDNLALFINKLNPQIIKFIFLSSTFVSESFIFKSIYLIIFYFSIFKIFLSNLKQIFSEIKHLIFYNNYFLSI